MRPCGVAEAPAFDPERLIRALARHRVGYILVGALAARIHGFPRLTADADITPARNADNLDRLAAALRELEAHVFTEAVPTGLAFDCSSRTLANAETWNLVTAAGRLDVLFQPSGTAGYEDLQRSAVRIHAFGVELRVACLADIMRSKEASARPQDRHDVAIMRAMLARSDSR